MASAKLSPSEAAGKLLAQLERVEGGTALAALGADGRAVRAIIERAVRVARATDRRLSK